jgi:hydrogenase maturation protease
VAGAGNWLLASDRIGPRVLAMAAERYPVGVELCDIGSTALSLLDSLRGQDLLIVIDACVGRGTPGEIFVIEPDLSAIPGRGTSTHQIGPVETLNIAQHLEPASMPRQTLLILVETGEFGAGDEEDACRRVIEVLDREIGLQRRQSGGESHERQS